VRGSQGFQKLSVNMAGDGPASRQGRCPLAWPLWGLGIRDGTDRSSLLPPRPSSRWQLPCGRAAALSPNALDRGQAVVCSLCVRRSRCFMMVVL
jgi:hypothetical protein